MLKENEVKFYNQNGYLILKDKLDKKTLSDLKNSTTQLIEEFKKNQSTFTLIALSPFMPKSTSNDTLCPGLSPRDCRCCLSPLT